MKRWGIMLREEIPSFDDDTLYLTRWKLIETPYFGVYLHRFDAPDSRPTLHDHPWPFISLVLRGGYVERRIDQKTMEIDEHHVVRRLNVMPLGGSHAIMKLLRPRVWTLMLVGRRRRTWGYWEPYISPSNGNEFWYWTEYRKHRHNDEYQAALERRRSA
jgi:hypothetical protein